MNGLFEHQQRGINKVIANGGVGALFWDMGLGKTRGAIEIYKEMKKKTPRLKLLVICPIGLMEAAWGEDIKKFSDYIYTNLRYDKQFKLNSSIYLANYEWVLNDKNFLVIRKMAMDDPFMCVLDESSRIKNHSAQTTKRILKLRDYFKYRVVMSGTPAPNIEWEYWPQVCFVKPDIVHPNFHFFKNDYFHLERNGQQMFTQGQVMNRVMAREIFSKGWKYAITNKKREDLVNRLRPWCDFARKEDCLDLPERTDENVFIELPAEQRSAYNQMKNDLIAEIRGQYITANVALTKLMKLREITSGFAFNEGGGLVEFEKNPKLNQLVESLEDVGNKQVIIWGNFTYEIEKIWNLLGHDRARALYGKTAAGRDDIIKGFQQNKFQYLIANPASAGYGLTFVNCNYQIFFSLSYSWEDYQQSRDRIYRIGQKNQCTYLHLIGRNTIDETILQVLKRKGDANDIVFEILK